ncbi:protein of unknown function DUF323 [Olavius sp. associated proteobacterium Delta 1]|nr:protein of unknown function DUF323 [Olavius sp. associated proteobacterium Delta 1]
MLLIIGEPGSGKTTLLKYYAMCCLTEGANQMLGINETMLPIYFPLRELEPDEAYPLPLPENLARWAGRHVLNISAETFRDWLHNRDTLILLDGLDEISELAQRKRVCEWIDNTAQGLIRARFVMASRWTGYRKADGIELAFDHLRADVKPFTPDQQAEFLKKWFSAVFSREYHDVNVPEAEWQQLQEIHALKKADTIIEYISDKKNKHLRELAAVPMLLQIMAIIWKERDHLPQSRPELYSAALKYLLDYRDRRRNLNPKLPADKAMRVLAPISLWMQETLIADEVAKSTLHKQMQPTIKTLDDELSSQSFCENLRDRAGLIADYGEDRYIFRHKSLREYLTGLQLVKDVQQQERLNKLVSCFGDDWWEEPLIFFISEADDNDFDRFMDTFFRADFSRELSPESQSLLQQMVEEASQRKIDSLVRLLKDRRIHSNKRYRQFIDYLAGQQTELADILSPDIYGSHVLKVSLKIEGFTEFIGEDIKNWPNILRSEYDEEKRFKGDDQPVVGVSWYAARAYCLWLSLIAAKEANVESEEATGWFRLPDEVEWEWAAAGRGPDDGLREYPWPSDKGGPSKNLANYDGNVGATTPVGQYSDGASPEGLHDMAGNVWEWMENWYDEDKDVRALRGGSWLNLDDALRCSARSNYAPDDRYLSFGFRVVRAQS